METNYSYPATWAAKTSIRTFNITCLKLTFFISTPPSVTVYIYIYVFAYVYVVYNHTFLLLYWFISLQHTRMSFYFPPVIIPKLKVNQVPTSPKMSRPKASSLQRWRGRQVDAWRPNPRNGRSNATKIHGKMVELNGFPCFSPHKKIGCRFWKSKIGTSNMSGKVFWGALSYLE